jgi:GNAT superfamily N-acetyltransferase
MSEPIDPTNTVVALCAQGMAVEGTPDAARAYFEQAWAMRRDDYDAAIAAHYLARHQSSLAETLRWNEIAAQHAERVEGGRAAALLPSLYLNLGDSYAAFGQRAQALEVVRRARQHVLELPLDGYRDFVASAIERLSERVESMVQVRSAVEADIEPLAALWFQGWHDAHASLFPPEVERHRTLDVFRARLHAALPSVRVVGVVGEPVGLCIVKGDELNQLYVAERARGTGVAAALVRDAESLIRAGGADTAWLACAIGNDRAARFYEKCGWRRAGVVAIQIQSADGDIPCEVWRYEKDVRASDRPRSPGS